MSLDIKIYSFHTMAYIYPARTLKPAFSFLFWDWLIKVVLKNTIVSVPCAVSSKHNILNIKRSTHAKTIMQITWDGRGKMNRGVELSSSLRQSKAGLEQEFAEFMAFVG